MTKQRKQPQSALTKRLTISIFSGLLSGLIFIIERLNKRVLLKLVNSVIIQRLVMQLSDRTFNKKNQYLTKNVNKVFPSFTDDDMQKFVQQHHTNMVMTALEEILLSNPKKIEYTLYGNQALNPNTGVIFFSAHLYAFSVIRLANKNAGYQTVSLFRQANNEIFSRLIYKRSNRYSQAFDTSQTQQFIQAIANNKHALICPDVRIKTGRNAQVLSFCNHPAWTSTFIADLAIKQGKMIVPVYSIRKGFCQYDIIYQQPIDTSSDNVNIIAQLINDSMSNMILQHPHAWWLWNSNRWGCVKSEHAIQ